MLDIKQLRHDRIHDYIEDIYVFASESVNWWRDRKIQERIMYIRNLSYVGDKFISKTS